MARKAEASGEPLEGQAPAKVARLDPCTSDAVSPPVGRKAAVISGTPVAGAHAPKLADGRPSTPTPLRALASSPAYTAALLRRAGRHLEPLPAHAVGAASETVKPNAGSMKNSLGRSGSALQLAQQSETELAALEAAAAKSEYVLRQHISQAEAELEQIQAAVTAQRDHCSRCNAESSSSSSAVSMDAFEAKWKERLRVLSETRAERTKAQEQAAADSISELSDKVTVWAQQKLDPVTYDQRLRDAQSGLEKERLRHMDVRTSAPRWLESSIHALRELLDQERSARAASHERLRMKLAKRAESVRETLEEEHWQRGERHSVLLESVRETLEEEHWQRGERHSVLLESVKRVLARVDGGADVGKCQAEHSEARTRVGKGLSTHDLPTMPTCTKTEAKVSSPLAASLTVANKQHLSESNTGLGSGGISQTSLSRQLLRTPIADSTLLYRDLHDARNTLLTAEEKLRQSEEQLARCQEAERHAEEREEDARIRASAHAISLREALTAVKKASRAHIEACSNQQDESQLQALKAALEAERSRGDEAAAALASSDSELRALVEVRQSAARRTASQVLAEQSSRADRANCAEKVRSLEKALKKHTAALEGVSRTTAAV
eukprot:gnl/TRDRNA2_/TRDRNA2_135501_c0_seq1.p1 gnl/TRDRNA2_/TRDRNA2_135501_c0~~gnl/TRDRNA2_/TRDRNA2_135501_c0_seq1.p1  ORF type:complete len:612 (+),score=129.04 gnl/TRDRNA2_/TRDRNA2_135501_c0_seq1:113-1948(+)